MRFETEEIPSLGTMQTYKNNTWEKLCTASWDDAEDNLTCMAMGYFNNAYNGTWYKNTTASNTTVLNTTVSNGKVSNKIALNTTVHHNCTALTQKCVNNSNEKLQSCEGIYYIRITKFESFLSTSINR